MTASSPLSHQRVSTPVKIPPLLLLALSSAAVAQPSTGPAADANAPRIFLAASDVDARVVQADAAAKAAVPFDAAHATPALVSAREQFEYDYLQKAGAALQAGPFRAFLDFHIMPRVGNGFRTHHNEAELLLVLKGTGALSVGGTLVDAKQVETDEFQNIQFQAPSANGATAHEMAAGSVILLPPDIVHGQTRVDGGGTVTMDLRLPFPAHAAAPSMSLKRAFLSRQDVEQRLAAADANIAADWAHSDHTPAARERLENAALQRGGALLESGPFRAVLDYRLAGVKHAPERHAKAAQLEVILEGAGTFTVGGTAYAVNRGDILLIPPGDAYALTQVSQDKVVMLSMPLPLP